MLFRSMVNDAKANEAEDKKRLEEVQSRNNLDTLAHSVKKSLTEYGDKIEAAEKTSIEAALKEAEELLKDQTASKEALDAKLESLSTVSQKLGEKMYAAAQAEQAAAGAAAGAAGGGESAGAAGGGGGKPGDDAKVVDADFTEVKDEKKAK